MPQTALTFVPADFLHSLCRYIVTQAAARTAPVALNYTGTPPRDLWRNLEPESSAGDPATVLRIYPGDKLEYTDRLPRLSVQAQTAGTVDDEVSTRAQTVFETLLDGDGKPLRSVTINGYKAANDGADGTYELVWVKPLQRPGVTGRDDRGRPVWSFNFDVGFRKLS